MSNVKVKIYEARSEVDRKRLLKITNDEMNRLPATTQVLIGETEHRLTMIAIEPIDSTWDWGDEFDEFTVTKGNFESRL